LVSDGILKAVFSFISYIKRVLIVLQDKPSSLQVKLVPGAPGMANYFLLPSQIHISPHVPLWFYHITQCKRESQKVKAILIYHVGTNKKGDGYK
jgi:hypothetical protein